MNRVEPNYSQNYYYRNSPNKRDKSQISLIHYFSSCLWRITPAIRQMTKKIKPPRIIELLTFSGVSIGVKTSIARISLEISSKVLPSMVRCCWSNFTIIDYSKT